MKIIWVLILVGYGVDAMNEIDNLISPPEDVPQKMIADVQRDIEHYLRKGFLRAEKIRQELAQDTNKLRSKRKRYTESSQLAAMKKPEAASHIMSSCEGLGLLETSRVIAESQKWTVSEIPILLEKIVVPDKLLEELRLVCNQEQSLKYGLPKYYYRPPISCVNNLYRTADGSCNNPFNLSWGASKQPFQRLLPASYEDGIGKPRTALLPTPRQVSLSMSKIGVTGKSNKVTQMLKLWGQFLDHDLVKTPESAAGIGSHGKIQVIACCENSRDVLSSSSECLPLDISSSDDYFARFDVRCLRFVRSAPAVVLNRLSHREQMNELTSFVDASNVYGSTAEDTIKLRQFAGGRLRIGPITEDSCTARCPLTFLPFNSEDPDSFFLAGDSRVNEQPSLASMHTIWLRLHNIIADKMYEAYRQDDEAIFQETRKIVIALAQHVTYTEFLPAVLGDDVMRQYELITPNDRYMDGNGYNLKYDPNLNPTIFNVFGAAAFRFGHTLVSGDMRGKHPFKLVRGFLNGELLTESGTGPSDIIEAECSTKAEKVDVLIDPTLTNSLFAPKTNNFTHGSDLLSLNIMRARDHGIPSYPQWREHCGLPSIRTRQDLFQYLDPSAASLFLNLYNDISDIDLFPGLLAETTSQFPNSNNGILGPTMKCLIAKQFYNLKYGDRFWYENGDDIQKYNPRSKLEPAQLDIIRKTSLAYIICKTTNIKRLPRRPMEVSGIDAPFGSENEFINCDRQSWEFPDMLIPSIESGTWWS